MEQEQKEQPRLWALWNKKTHTYFHPTFLAIPILYSSIDALNWLKLNRKTQYPNIEDYEIVEVVIQQRFP